MSEAVTASSLIPQLPMSIEGFGTLLSGNAFFYDPVIKALMWEAMQLQGEIGDQKDADLIGRLKVWTPSEASEDCQWSTLCQKIIFWFQKIWHQLRLFCGSTYSEQFDAAQARLMSLYTGIQMEYQEAEAMHQQQLQNQLQELINRRDSLIQQNEAIAKTLQQMAPSQKTAADLLSSGWDQLVNGLMNLFEPSAESRQSADQGQTEKRGFAISKGLVDVNSNGRLSVNREVFGDLLVFASEHSLEAAKQLGAAQGSHQGVQSVGAVIEAISCNRRLIEFWSLSKQLRGNEVTCGVLEVQIRALEEQGAALPLPLTEDLSEEEAITGSSFVSTYADRLSRVEQRMLRDMAVLSHPDIAQMWDLLLRKCYDSGHFTNGVVKSWILHPDGQFEIQLYQPIIVWSNNSAYAAGGGVLLKYGVNALAPNRIRGTLIKDTPLPEEHAELASITIKDMNRPGVGILYHYDKERNRGDIETYLHYQKLGFDLWPIVGLRHMLRIGEEGENLLMTGTASVKVTFLHVVRSEGKTNSYQISERGWGEGTILPTQRSITVEQCRQYIQTQASAYSAVQAKSISRKDANARALQAVGL